MHPSTMIRGYEKRANMKQLSPTEAKRETDWAEVEKEDEMHYRTPERDGVLLTKIFNCCVHVSHATLDEKCRARYPRKYQTPFQPCLLFVGYDDADVSNRSRMCQRAQRQEDVCRSRAGLRIIRDSIEAHSAFLRHLGVLILFRVWTRSLVGQRAGRRLM